MIEIDGAMGEGGGQVLRSSLTMAALLGQPVEIRRIRANRRKSGLLRQHLTALMASAEISNARVEGAELGSDCIRFFPQALRPGEYQFSIGSAGSTLLVLQTILPLLMRAEGESCVEIQGGTHNPMAPTFDYVDQVLAPILRRMGAQLELTLLEPGFFPAGGGRIRCRVQGGTLNPISLLEWSEVVTMRGVAMVSAVSRRVAKRQLGVFKEAFQMDRENLHLRQVRSPRGPGNCIWLTLESENGIQLISGIGKKGRLAEDVAGDVVHAAQAYLSAKLPVGEYLADQLLLPMFMAGGGAFLTGPLSSHTRTNIEVLRQFSDLPVQIDEQKGRTLVHLGALNR